jgi:hypothetical protein
MNADPADTARNINLTGQSMSQLRTANNRRNRALRNAMGREQAAAADTLPVATPKTAKPKVKPAQAAS